MTEDAERGKMSSIERIYVGIDPGASGGIAAIYHWKGSVGLTGLWAWKDENTTSEIMSSFDTLRNPNVWVQALIENVHAFPSDARSSAFKFGMNFGLWKGLLTAYGISYKLIIPQQWMKQYGEVKKDKRERKNQLKGWAYQIAKSLDYDGKITLKTADALLIANCLSNQYLPEGEQLWLKT